MDSLETAHRFHFAFTIVYHYIFPQLTMGLALLIFALKTIAIRRDDPVANAAVRFWSKVFAINFAMGVVTGIPMEFQFGTNWSRFSEATGGIIGQTLAMEGLFAFFLESSFLYLLLYGEKRLGQRGHWFACLAVMLGSWLSGFFIVATNAWMQHPVGYELADDGTIVLREFTALLTNPWLPWQYLHTMLGAVVTGSFFMAGVGAFYLLLRKHDAQARLFVKTGAIAGAIAVTLSAFPTGDQQAKNVAAHQPITFAAMEGHFDTEDGAGLVIIGQPNMDTLTIDNEIRVPNMLSFMTHMRWTSKVRGLREFDRDEWPDNVPLLYYAYHVMVGLGTMFMAVMAMAVWSLWRGTLYAVRWKLWLIACALPFPFIANIAGWTTAELGRQPWLVHGLLRTSDGYSTNVSTGNVLFSLLGWMGMYVVLSLLYFFLMTRTINAGPASASEEAAT